MTFLAGGRGRAHTRILEVQAVKGIAHGGICDVQIAYHHLGLLLRQLFGSLFRDNTLLCMNGTRNQHQQKQERDIDETIQVHIQSDSKKYAKP